MIAKHFINALQNAKRIEEPFLRWSVRSVFPESFCSEILKLPITPFSVENADGTRDSYNDMRAFFTPSMRSQFNICEELSQVLQNIDVAKQLGKTCEFELTSDMYVRAEYIQDVDGMWLEPHRDIKEKIFSMVIYLCAGPEAKNWGTDIYDSQKKWVSCMAPEFNSAAIFKAGPNTWHGFEPRKIIGVRRLIEINYVRNWRDKEQLAFPNQPIPIV